MNSKSQQNVIVTVILILVAIVAVAFVAVFVFKEVKTNIEVADVQTELQTVGLEVVGYDSAKNTITIKRYPDEVDLYGIRVVGVLDDGSEISKDILQNLGLPEPLETKSYSLDPIKGFTFAKIFKLFPMGETTSGAFVIALPSGGGDTGRKIGGGGGGGAGSGTPWGCDPKDPCCGISSCKDSLNCTADICHEGTCSHNPIAYCTEMYS